MQSWILDYDFKKSASYLDRHRLQANIFENIHGLASLLNINDKLVNPKRSVANHPNIKRWIGYETEYFCYILGHLIIWDKKFAKNKGDTINSINMCLLSKYINLSEIISILCFNSSLTKPSWINPELIKQHQEILLKKDFEYYSQYFK